MHGRGLNTRHKFSSRENPRNHADFIWSVADLLRGDYKLSEYGKVVLPLTVLRRLDSVLVPTKQRRRTEARTREALIETMGKALSAVSARDARGFFEHSGYCAMGQPF